MVIYLFSRIGLTSCLNTWGSPLYRPIISFLPFPKFFIPTWPSQLVVDRGFVPLAWCFRFGGTSFALDVLQTERCKHWHLVSILKIITCNQLIKHDWTTSCHQVSHLSFLCSSFSHYENQYFHNGPVGLKCSIELCNYEIITPSPLGLWV